MGSKWTGGRVHAQGEAHCAACAPAVTRPTTPAPCPRPLSCCSGEWSSDGEEWGSLEPRGQDGGGAAPAASPARPGAPPPGIGFLDFLFLSGAVHGASCSFPRIIAPAPGDEHPGDRWAGGGFVSGWVGGSNGAGGFAGAGAAADRSSGASGSLIRKFNMQGAGLTQGGLTRGWADQRVGWLEGVAPREGKLAHLPQAPALWQRRCGADQAAGQLGAAGGLVAWPGAASRTAGERRPAAGACRGSRHWAFHWAGGGWAPSRCPAAPAAHAAREPLFSGHAVPKTQPCMAHAACQPRLLGWSFLWGWRCGISSPNAVANRRR